MALRGVYKAVAISAALLFLGMSFIVLESGNQYSVSESASEDVPVIYTPNCSSDTFKPIPKVAKIGQKYTIPIDSANYYEQSGYNLVGWTNASNDYFYNFGDEIMVNAELTLRAKWEPMKFKAIYHSNYVGSPDVQEQTVDYMAEYRLMSNSFHRDGYAFIGWSRDSGGDILLVENALITAFNSCTNVNYYAIWRSSPYNVIYHSNDGTERITTDEARYEMPYDGGSNLYVRSGYVFDHWNTSPNGNGTSYGKNVSISNYRFTSDFNLYAIWEPNTYTVSFDYRGAGPGIASKSCTYDGTYGNLPQTVREGYTFDGWYTEAVAGEKITSASAVRTASDHTLYAHWTSTGYSLSISYEYAKGGSASVTHSETVSYNAAYSVNSPAIDGYTPDRTVVAGNMPSSDVSIVVRYSPNNYSLTFDANSGSVSTASKTVTYGDAYGILPTPTRSGFNFDGWYTSSSGGYRITDASTVGTAADSTLYAHWIAEDPIYYTVNVTADPYNGGTVSGGGSVPKGSTVEVSAVENTGFVFVRWSDGGAKTHTIQVESDVGLTAYFKKATYNIDLAASPAEGGTVAGNGIFDSGSTVRISASEAEGYVFIGWSDGSKGKERDITVTGNLALTALFSLKDEESLMNMISLAILSSKNDVDLYMSMADFDTEGESVIDNSVMIPKVVDGKKIKIHIKDIDGDVMYRLFFDCGTTYNETSISSILDVRAKGSFDPLDVFSPDVADRISSDMGDRGNMFFVDHGLSGPTPYSAEISFNMGGHNGERYSLFGYDESSGSMADLEKECTVSSDGYVTVNAYGSLAYVLVPVNGGTDTTAEKNPIVPVVIVLIVSLAAVLSLLAYRRGLR